MARIIFQTSRHLASIYGPQRIDFEAGGLRVVVHMHTHPPGTLYAGSPALMVSRLPDLTAPEDGFGWLSEDEWTEAIAAEPVLAEVRRIAALLDDPSITTPRAFSEYRSLCERIGLDPDWTFGQGEKK